MQYTFSDEQMQFRDIVKRFMADKSPSSEVRRLMATEAGYDPEVWRQLCDELGLAAVHVPEAYGGQGYGLVELGIVMEEMGRSLLCAPYFSSVLAQTAILNAATEDQKVSLLPKLASGEAIGTLAVVEAAGSWDPAAIETSYESDGAGYRLQGTKSFVTDGAIADVIVVVARRTGSSGADGLAFFVVNDSPDGLGRRPLETVDATRKLAELSFDRVPATLIGEPEGSGNALRRTLDLAAVALANEMVGGAQQLLESAVAYAKMRVQFGRTIGSFQAIKHKCADMLLEVELAKSAAYCAASAADDGDANLGALASLAKSSAADAYVRAAAETIQIHGGIGFTWDNDTHLWFKRAKSSEVMLGDPGYHRELMMQRWDGGATS